MCILSDDDLLNKKNKMKWAKGLERITKLLGRWKEFVTSPNQSDRNESQTNHPDGDDDDDDQTDWTGAKRDPHPPNTANKHLSAKEENFQENGHSLVCFSSWKHDFLCDERILRTIRRMIIRIVNDVEDRNDQSNRFSALQIASEWIQSRNKLPKRFFLHHLK